MNDTTRRFLSEVVTHVGEERIVEMRLFPAIRQGGIESAVAVLAVEPKPPLPAASDGDPELAYDESTLIESESLIATPSLAEYLGDKERSGTGHDPTVALTDRVAELRVASDAPSAKAEAEHDDSPYAPTGSAAEREVPLVSTAADAPLSLVERDDSLALGDILALPAPEPNPLAPPREREHSAPERLEIHSARYVFVFKGPERGKWTLDVVHEADAPLETLERVVLGVARRAGDTAETEMYTAETLRHALDQPVWA